MGSRCSSLILTTLAFLAVHDARAAPGQADFVVQLGHTSGVTSVAVSPDGRFVASGSGDKTVKLWHLASGREIRSFARPEGDVSSVAFSPDSRLVAASGWGGQLRVWGIESGEVIATAAPARDRAVGLRFVSGRAIAVAYADRLVVWSLEKNAAESEVRAEGIQCFDVAPGGRHAVSCAKSGAPQIWSLPELKPLRQITAAKDVSSARYSEDGKLLVTAAADGSVKVWNAQSGELVRAVREADGARVWEARVAQNAGVVLARMLNGSTRVIELASGRDLGRIDSPSEDNAMALTADGAIAVIGSGGIHSDHAVRLWDLKRRTLIRELKRYGSAVRSVAVAPDEQHVVTGDEDGSIRVWETATGRLARVLPAHEGEVFALAFSADGRTLLSGGDDRVVLWDFVSGTVAEEMKMPRHRLATAALSRDARSVVTGGRDHRVHVWERGDTKPTRTLEGHADGVTRVFLSRDGARIVSRAYGGEIRVWETATGRLVRAIEDAHGAITALALSPDGETIASGGSTSVALWSTETGEKLREVGGDKGSITHLVFSGDGKALLICGWDGTIQMWDPATGADLGRFEGHRASVQAAALSPKGERLYSASADGTLGVWDVPTRKLIVRSIGFRGSNEWMSVAPDGPYHASPRAYFGVHAVSGLDVLGPEQVDLRFNRPDVILSRLGRSSAEEILVLQRARERRLRKIGVDPAALEAARAGSGPWVKVQGPDKDTFETSNPSVSYLVSAGGSQPIKSLLVDVGGVPLFGVAGKRVAPKREVSEKISIELVPGKQVITFAALDANGVESPRIRKELLFQPKEPQKPDLHVVLIGASKFRQSDYDLMYAAKDARDFVHFQRVRDARYGAIREHAFLDQDVVREKVLEVRKELLKSRPADFVYVFVASHGLLDDELDYIIATHDTDFSNPGARGLRYEDLEGLLDGIPARHKVMFLDACHSGELDAEAAEVTAAPVPGAGTVKSRGFKRTQSKVKRLGLAQTVRLTTELFADLRRNSGTVVVASAAGTELAFEGDEWKNGVFTYAIIEGLRKRTADLNRDEQIAISELRAHVSRRVVELTGGKQHPTARAENLENDFLFW